MESQESVRPPLDEATILRMRACTCEQFPLCLEGALLEILGPTGKESLDSINRRSGFETHRARSPGDVWDLYRKYVAISGLKLGEGAAKVIRLHAVARMQSMGCTRCPLYDAERQSLGPCSDPGPRVLVGMG